MDYEKKYNEALERARKIHNEIINNEIIGFPDRIREIFPELRESEDERIRKWIIEEFKIHYDFESPSLNPMVEKALAWLEKQKKQENASASTMIPSCWEVEQKEQKPAEWSEEDKRLIEYAIERARKDAVQDLAVWFMRYLDEHRPEGKMCLSNGECMDIEKAFAEKDWGKIIRYANKYQPHWKPSEEQMEALLWCTAHLGGADHRVLAELYEQLKKL